MSLLKAIKAQLGLSNTPANNFTVHAPDDGTLKLARGNAGATTQDILTVDASGKVAFPQNAQTWQNVIGSRTLAGSYTNNTGFAIVVSISLVNQSSSGAFGASLIVGGVSVAQQYAIQQTGAGNYFVTLTATVPNGAEYHLAFGTSVAVATWAELR